MTQSETKTIAVIDGNSLMHRAFHAVPPAMTAPDGTPTNAAFGFYLCSSSLSKRRILMLLFALLIEGDLRFEWKRSSSTRHSVRRWTLA